MSFTVRRCSALLCLVFFAACQTPGPDRLSPEARARLAEATRGSDGQISLPLARQAAQASTRNAATLTQWAAAAEQAGQFAEAAEAQRALMALEGRSERRLNSIGRLLLRAGDSSGAVEAYSQALNLAPRSVAAASGLGLAQDMAGNPAEAQQAYRQGLAVAPTNWDLRTNLGMSLITSGNPREALVVLGDAELLPSAPSPARHNLALAFAATNQLDRTVSVLRPELGEAGALSMAQQMAAFARWLTPGADGQAFRPTITATSGVVAMEPIAARSRASARRARN